MGNNARLQLFLSHSHDEASLAVALADQIDFDFLGLIQVFVSSNRSNILPGADWLDRLKERIQSSDVFAVLCSNRSVLQPWVNIELGAATFRTPKPIVIPLCHSDLAKGALETPLDRTQAIRIAEPDGIQALYQRLACELGSRTPRVNFEAIANNLKKFEDEYRENNRVKEQSAQVPLSEQPSLRETYRHPAVLCVSSRQFEESATEAINLIRGFLPARLNHKVVLNSADLREELGNKSYDIIHLALYIRPVTGDLVFGDMDSDCRQTTCAEPDAMSAHDFAKLVRVSRTSLVVVTAPEPLTFVAKLLPFTNIVFPSGPVEPEALAKWMGAFYSLLAKPVILRDAAERASAQHCSCMMLYPKLSTAMGAEEDSRPARAVAL